VTVLGMVAEMERKFIRERQQAGIKVAKAKGVYNVITPSMAAKEPGKLVQHGAARISRVLQDPLRPHNGTSEGDHRHAGAGPYDFWGSTNQEQAQNEP